MTERLLARSDKTRELLETDHWAGGVNIVLTLTYQPITCHGVSDEFQSMSLQNAEIGADDRLRRALTIHRTSVRLPAVPIFAKVTRYWGQAGVLNFLILDPRVREVTGNAATAPYA